MNLKTEIKELFDTQDDTTVEKLFFRSDVSHDHRFDQACLTAFKAELNKAGIEFNQEAKHGGEGMGDEYWSVYSFSKGVEKVYVKFDGWYQSYNGSEYNEWFFVKTQEVVVTQYVKTT
jgi:hypothetical protein